MLIAVCNYHSDLAYDRGTIFDFTKKTDGSDFLVSPQFVISVVSADFDFVFQRIV